MRGGALVLPGPAGVGKDGRGISNASIGQNGHLFVTYTDGSIMDAGDAQGTQIKVGNGPPNGAADPGDLYLDALSGDLYRMES